MYINYGKDYAGLTKRLQNALAYISLKFLLLLPTSPGQKVGLHSMRSPRFLASPTLV